MGEMYDLAESRAMDELAKSENKMTYEEWRLAGYFVRRGERSIGRNANGVPVFSELQVDEYGYSDEEMEMLGISSADLF